MFGLASDKRQRFYILDFQNKQMVQKPSKSASPLDEKNQITFFKEIIKVEEK